MAHFSEQGGAPGKAQGNGFAAGARVVDAAGHEATIVSTEHDQAAPQARIRLASGAQVLVPLDLLARRDDGVFRLPFAIAVDSEPEERIEMAFPVVEEQLDVGKRTVDTGRGVRLHKTVSQREQVLDEPLRRDELVVEHVPVGRVVSEAAPPQARYEGDTLVVPVLEEVLVVQKQLRLKEEVRITRRQQQVREPQSVVLRTEQVRVERFEEGRGRPS